MHPTARRCVWVAAALWVAGAALVGLAPALYDLASGWVGGALNIVVGFLQAALVPTGAALVAAAVVVQALRGTRPSAIAPDDVRPATGTVPVVALRPPTGTVPVVGLRPPTGTIPVVGPPGAPPQPGPPGMAPPGHNRPPTAGVPAAPAKKRVLRTGMIPVARPDRSGAATPPDGPSRPSRASKRRGG
ncbi:MAG: hypothetical protein FWD11_11040 [Micrococcales bacterium]|nr:hypothetical protein [Micrococcales bacterium]